MLVNARADWTAQPRRFSCWLIGLTEPSREMTVTSFMVARGVPFWLPTYPCRRTHRGDRKVTVLRPLLRGYVLVGVRRIEDDCAELSRIPHLRGIMHSGDWPATIADYELDMLREQEKMLNDPSYINPELPYRYSLNERVRLVEELWQGVLGRVTGVDKAGKIRIETDQGTKLTVRHGQIEPVGANP